MRRILFILFLSAKAAAQIPQISIDTYTGETDVAFSFSLNSYTIEVMCDTTLNFDSKYLRKKTTNKLADSFRNLKLGKKYYIKSHFISGPNLNWSLGEYSTASYPLPKLFNAGGSITYQNIPLYYYASEYNAVNTELWYDTVPGFNSSALLKFNATVYNTLFLFRNTENYKSYYLKGRTYKGKDTLPWKTIKVLNKFRPEIVAELDICNDTNSIPLILGFRNIIPNVVSNKTTGIVYYKNKIDTIKTITSYTNYNTNDTSVFKVVSVFQITYPTYSRIYIDTQIIRNPLQKFDVQYSVNNGSNSQINFIIGTTCNTEVELEMYTDSTLSNQLLHTYKKNSQRVGASLQFAVNWDPFSPKLIRFRYNRYKIHSDWTYYFPASFKLILEYSLNQFDTMVSDWFAYKSYNNSNYQMEIWLDTTPAFNSGKLNKRISNDSAFVRANSLFAKKNYIKCRLFQNGNYTEWSNTVYKNFTDAPVRPSIQYTNPLTTVNMYPVSPLDGVELRMGRSPGKLNKKAFFQNSSFKDTFDFIENETVYYQARRFTKLDTSVWGGIRTTQLQFYPNYCITPKIIYNGNSNNKDTFTIKWVEKKASIAEGYYLILGKAKYEYSAIIPIPKGTNSYTIDKKEFPSDWYYALYPICTTPRYISLLEPSWLPLNLNSSSFNSSNKALTNFYFNSNELSINSLTDKDYKCSIYDIQGRLLYTNPIPANGKILLPEFASGRYYAIFENNYFHTTLPFLIP